MPVDTHNLRENQIRSENPLVLNNKIMKVNKIITNKDLKLMHNKILLTSSKISKIITSIIMKMIEIAKIDITTILTIILTLFIITIISNSNNLSTITNLTIHTIMTMIRKILMNFNLLITHLSLVHPNILQMSLQ